MGWLDDLKSTVAAKLNPLNAGLNNKKAPKKEVVSPSIWSSEKTSDASLKELQEKKNRCDGKWNSFKAMFGCEEKMSKEEINRYHDLSMKARLDQIHKERGGRNDDWFN